jgi:hypothetical protein
MKYEIITNDSWTENGIPQVFLQIEITDKGEVWRKAARLHAKDVDKVLADPAQIDVIASEMADKAVANKPKEKTDEEYFKTLELEQIKLETINSELELERIKLEALNVELELEKTKLAVLQLSITKA